MPDTKLTALVVDDSSFMREVLKDILLSHEFSLVFEATNGSEATEKFKRHTPDIVTMDLIMPGSDGLEGLKEILKIDPQAKVIMITSLAEKHLVTETLKLGAKGCLVKPFKDSEVVSTIAAILKQG